MGAQYTSAVPAIVPDEEDLPGWVPKNYIEKGIFFIYLIHIVFYVVSIGPPYLFSAVYIFIYYLLTNYTLSSISLLAVKHDITRRIVVIYNIRIRKKHRHLMASYKKLVDVKYSPYFKIMGY